MIRVGDRIRWDPHRSPSQAQISRCETGIIDGILPVGFGHVDDRILQGTINQIATLFITLDDGVRTAFGVDLVVEINRVRRPDLSKDEVARLWGS